MEFLIGLLIAAMAATQPTSMQSAQLAQDMGIAAEADCERGEVENVEDYNQ